MSKHTPGPWDYFVGNANGRGLIRIEGEGTGEHIASMPRGAVSESNARLIAAAPDLLAALEDLVGYAAAEIGIPPNEAVGGAFKQARAAIAKARGQA